jgi:hypothetical protein
MHVLIHNPGGVYVSSSDARDRASARTESHP